jgi:hypothetical protein
LQNIFLRVEIQEELSLGKNYENSYEREVEEFVLPGYHIRPINLINDFRRDLNKNVF